MVSLIRPSICILRKQISDSIIVLLKTLYEVVKGFFIFRLLMMTVNGFPWVVMDFPLTKAEVSSIQNPFCQITQIIQKKFFSS